MILSVHGLSIGQGLEENIFGLVVPLLLAIYLAQNLPDFVYADNRILSEGISVVQDLFAKTLALRIANQINVALC